MSESLGIAQTFVLGAAALFQIQPEMKKSMYVPAGLLDGSMKARVTKHLFVGSKAEWDEIGGFGVHYEAGAKV